MVCSSLGCTSHPSRGLKPFQYLSLMTTQFCCTSHPSRGLKQPEEIQNQHILFRCTSHPSRGLKHGLVQRDRPSFLRYTSHPSRGLKRFVHVVFCSMVARYTSHPSRGLKRCFQRNLHPVDQVLHFIPIIGTETRSKCPGISLPHLVTLHTPTGTETSQRLGTFQYYRSRYNSQAYGD